jgi:hypothetical protein
VLKWFAKVTTLTGAPAGEEGHNAPVHARGVARGTTSNAAHAGSHTSGTTLKPRIECAECAIFCLAMILCPPLPPHVPRYRSR